MNKFFFILFLSLAFGVSAQDIEKNKALAKQYYSTGNFEKAAVLYEELFNSEKNSYSYYTYLFNSLLRINEYDKLEKIVKKQIKKQKGQDQYFVDLGYVYSQNNQSNKAFIEYDKAINNLTANEGAIKNIAFKFIAFRLNDYVVKTYKKGNKLFKSESKFAFELGDAFIKLNKPDQAVKYWLDYLEAIPGQKGRMQTTFSRNLELENFQSDLETELYSRIQQKPNNTIFVEILIWLFTNQKDYESALIQAKALDKKLKEDAYRILSISQNAMREEDYDAAISGYEYVVEKGPEFRYFSMAKSQMLEARKLKITKTGVYSQEDLLALKNDFETYLEDYGSNAANAKTIRELANLEANYLGNAQGAIKLLEDIIARGGLPKKVKNAIKLDLGDYYILTDDVWESVLLYAQVDKDEKDSPLGEDARYRNAKLSYYNGDFEWAQAQLTVLKGATTELIANDALNLSIFIIDNLGLDTTTTPMEMFADAELLTIQNKNSEALTLLDQIMKLFPAHNLTDDILFKKAGINKKTGNFLQAEKNLLDLLVAYNQDILADNATFMLAELYEGQINNKEKAKEYYEKIILDFSNSVLLIEARKRYRKLRNDNL